MRALTEEERQQLAGIRDRLPAIQAEVWPMLRDLFGKLGFAPPPTGARPATWYLPAFDQWMSAQTISPDDLPWIMARVAAFLGELVVERWHGSWFVNELPDTRFFARIVVGRFPEMADPNVMIEPYLAAREFLSAPLGRSLTRVLSVIEEELKQHSR